MENLAIRQALATALSDEEKDLLLESLAALRKLKQDALVTVNVEFGARENFQPFTREDFGIPAIDRLTAKLGED